MLFKRKVLQNDKLFEFEILTRDFNFTKLFQMQLRLNNELMSSNLFYFSLIQAS